MTLILSRSIGQSTMQCNWNWNATWLTIRMELADRLKTAAIIYQNQLKMALRVRGSIDIGSGFVVAISRSSPGQPPFWQTGNLHESIEYNVDRVNLSAYIHTDVPYAPVLELGGTFDDPNPPQHVNKVVLNRPRGKYIAPRPVWLPTLLNLLNQIVRTLAGY